MRDIGKNIRQLRAKKNLTQDELAERLFVSRQTVSNYETGRSRPDIDTLIRISEILETDIQDLLYGPSDNRPQAEEKYRLLIACGILVGTAILCKVVDLCVDPYYELENWYFRQGSAYLLWLLLQPCLFLLIGWTAIQSLSLLPRVRIAPYCMKTAYRIIAAILAAYFLIHIIFYGESAIEYHVRCWATVDNFWDANFALLENIKTVFDQDGITMTYNHLNVHIVEK